MRDQPASPWHSHPLGELTAKIQDGTHFSPTSKSGPFRYVTSKNIRVGQLDLGNCEWISEREHRSIYQRCDVRLGDVLLTKDGVNTGNACINFLAEEISLLSSVAFIRPDEVRLHANFALQYLLSPAAQARIQDMMSGNAIRRLTLKKIKSFTVPVPSLPEQRQIAAILDTIDDAIRKTEQIIAKLKQVKQGLLHDLLTRGIDDNGELRNPERHPEQFKDSLLGRIPRGWEVAPLGHTLSRIEAGKSPSCPDRPAQGNDWGVLKVSAVRPTGFRASENKVIVNAAHIDPSLEVQHGDLLITRANTYELVGLTCLVEQPPPRLMLCDKTLRLVADAEKGDVRFIFFTTQMPYVRAQIETCATGSSGSMKNIGQDAIRALRIRLAPRNEQSAIATHLGAIDSRIATEARSLGSARMLKIGLMEDLLTGRVRVTKLLEHAAP
jgi:type I restriction enzyme S subunit